MYTWSVCVCVFARDRVCVPPCILYSSTRCMSWRYAAASPLTRWRNHDSPTQHPAANTTRTRSQHTHAAAQHTYTNTHTHTNNIFYMYDSCGVLVVRLADSVGPLLAVSRASSSSSQATHKAPTKKNTQSMRGVFAAVCCSLLLLDENADRGRSRSQVASSHHRARRSTKYNDHSRDRHDGTKKCVRSSGSSSKNSKP